MHFIEQSNSIHYTAQDPEFTDSDIGFLRTLGFNVVKDPVGFSKIDNNTLLHAIELGSYEWNMVFQRPQPAAIIAFDTEILDKEVSNHLSAYKKLKLPLYADPSADEPDEPHDWVCFYVRK